MKIPKWADRTWGWGRANEYEKDEYLRVDVCDNREAYRVIIDEQSSPALLAPEAREIGKHLIRCADWCDRANKRSKT